MPTEAVPVPDGATAFLSVNNTDLRDVIEMIAGELDNAGCSGDLHAFLEGFEPWRWSADLLECRLSLHAQPQPMAHGRFKWDVPSDLRGLIIDLALDWCRLTDPDQRLGLSIDVVEYATEPDVARTLLPLALADKAAGIRLRREGPDVFRTVFFYLSQARVSFVEGSSEGSHIDRETTLAAMEQILADAASIAPYGLVKGGSSLHPIDASRSLTDDWVELPHLHGGDAPVMADRLRRLEERLVPDVFGMQLLSRGHRDRVPTTSAWVTTELDHGGVLVKHRDVAAWYEGAKPDPVVHESARRDFAALLVSPHTIP